MNIPSADGTVSQAIQYPAIPALSLKNQRRHLKLWLLCTDILAVAWAFQFAVWIRFVIKLTVAPEYVPPSGVYPILFALVLPLWILLLLLFNLYSLKIKLGGIAEYKRIFNASSTGAMVLVLLLFFSRHFVVSRSWLVSFWLLSFFLIALSRFINRRVVYSLRKKGFMLTPAVIVGINREAVALASDLSDWPVSGLRLLGFASGNGEQIQNGPMNLPILGAVGEIRRLIAAHGIEDVIVAVTALSNEELLKLGEELNAIPNVNLRISSGLYELFTTGVTVRTVGTVPLVSLNKMRLEPIEAFIKRTMDLVLTFCLLFLAWPIFLIIALLVKLDSPGPAIHRHKVLGISGRQFDAFKFRTMFLNGDEILRDHPELVQKLQTEYKLKNDPRVTRVGRWLRKLSLDELPQLFNIILGNMSLVGPRFITTVEAEKKYGHQRLNLLTVRPGITGLWQVSGRSDISYEERIRLDMYYIRNYSIWLDLQILFVQTPPAVLKKRGAY
ncbi:MAG: sugar transferase [Acidobacteria bacterium]|nr:sugar transferase [Acidobacteriota bacterium]